jgi:hypothetical protein
VEAERQRKFTEDINAAGTILTSVRSPGTFVRSDQVQLGSPATQTDAYSNIRPIFLAFIKDPTGQFSILEVTPLFTPPISF